MPILKAFLILLAILIVVQLFVFLLLKVAFSRRSDNDPHLKYFTVADFDDLEGREIEFLSGKNTLRGYIYTGVDQRPQRLAIFCMGIGAGHQAYTHVIRLIALHGYQVLAFDYTGAQLSDGRSIKGLPQPLLDLKSAFSYIEREEQLKDLPIDIIGHSWGGYVAALAPLINKNINKVVSIAGFNSVPTILASVRPWLKILQPFIDFANLIIFKECGVYDILTSIKKSQVPMLFIAGKEDPFVKVAQNFDKFAFLAKDKPDLEFYLDEDKKHNPYLSVAGETYFIKIIKEKKQYDKLIGSKEAQAFFASIDYQLITENDPRIFQAMFAFLDK